MAYIFKEKKTPYYAAYWKTPDGRRRHKTTKSTDPKEAQRIANSLELSGELARRASDNEAARKQIVEVFKADILGADNKTPACNVWLNQWLEGKKANLAIRTLERYEFCIQNFLKLLGARAEKPLDCITAQDFISFKNRLVAQGKRATTVNYDIKIIRSALEKAKNIGYINQNPSHAIELLLKGTDSVERQPFTLEQLAAILKASEGTDWHGAVLMGYFTALRLGDIANLSWTSIDLEAQEITVTPQKTKKRGKVVVIPIHNQLYDWLKKQPTPIKKEIAVFQTLSGTTPGGNCGLSQKFAKIMKKAGVDRGIVQAKPGSRQGSTLSFHSLRHTFASELANKGVSPEIRMKLTGHSSIKVHEGYTHFKTETVRDAVEKISAIGA